MFLRSTCNSNITDNPACKDAPGCGEWKRPMMPNPEYKGKWKPPMIDNPNYQVYEFVIQNGWHFNESQHVQ